MPPASSVVLPPTRIGRLLRPLVATGLVALASAPGAQAAELRAPAETLGVVGANVRPDCASSTGATGGGGGAGSGGVTDAFGVPAAAAAEFAGAVQAAELLPALSICSPTFSGIPGPFSGTIASDPTRSRVGAGWRELGESLLEPAALTPGDVVTVPGVDDAATLRVALAKERGQPAATVAIDDLFPGPSRLAIGRDERGVVATLTRADGTSAQATAQPPVPSTPKATITGTARRWSIRLTGVPGAVIALGSDDSYGAPTSFGSADADGGTTIRLQPVRRIRPGRMSRLSGVAASRGAQSLVQFGCRVRVDRRSRPARIHCSPVGAEEVREGFDGSSLGSDGWDDFFDGAERYVRTSLDSALVRGARAEIGATGNAPVAHRNAVMGRSAAPADAPLAARAITLASTVRRATLGGLHPFAVDLNGDGDPDFWTDRTSGAPRWWPAYGGSAGLVLISGPAGLSPHRVDLPSASGDASPSLSELSAIDDITGDGVGELVIDLGERHAIVPGSRTWTATTFPIRAPRPDDLASADLVVAPAVSSPGNAYGTLDDVTGDGLRELAATDDLGGWTSISPPALTPGTITRLATPARVPDVPKALQETYGFDSAAPRVDPRTRIIAGRAISLRWPKVASSASPGGTVEITIRDARGAVIGAPARVTTPGNAILLDHDRVTGDALLLSVEPTCLGSTYFARRACREHLLRVRADGSVRQQVAVRTIRSIGYVAGARFIDDGPDVDADADVVYPVGNQAVAGLDSTRSGAVAATDVPFARITQADRPFFQELRLIPVLGAGGRRRITIALPEQHKAGYPYEVETFEAEGALPAEIVWR